MVKLCCFVSSKVGGTSHQLKLFISSSITVTSLPSSYILVLLTTTGPLVQISTSSYRRYTSITTFPPWRSTEDRSRPLHFSEFLGLNKAYFDAANEKNELPFSVYLRVELPLLYDNSQYSRYLREFKNDSPSLHKIWKQVQDLSFPP